MKVLITSGGTRVPIDRVRHIANMSRGTFGSKLAESFLLQRPSTDVKFLRAVGSRSPLSVNIDLHKTSIEVALSQLSDLASFKQQVDGRYSEIEYKNFKEYAQSLESLCKATQAPDIILLAAAASDYGTTPLKGKVRSKESEMSIPLKKLPKLIRRVRKWCPDAFLVGFKLLVDSTEGELIAAARDSIKKNGCDLVVANDLRDIQNANHSVILVSKGTSEVQRMTSFMAHGQHSSLAHFVVQEVLEGWNWKGAK